MYCATQIDDGALRCPICGAEQVPASSDVVLSMHPYIDVLHQFEFGADAKVLVEDVGFRNWFEAKFNRKPEDVIRALFKQKALVGLDLRRIIEEYWTEADLHVHATEFATKPMRKIPDLIVHVLTSPGGIIYQGTQDRYLRASIAGQLTLFEFKSKLAQTYPLVDTTRDKILS